MIGSTPSSTGPGRSGFSLVELIYVLVLVGVLVGIAMPRIDFQRARVDSAALQLGSHLLLAQRVAVLKQHDVRISFDETARTVVIHMDADNDGTTAATEQTRTEAIEEGVRFALAGAALYGGGAALTFEKDADELPTLVFHRNGSASEEGAVHLTSLSPYGPQHDRAVRITRATGLARCWSRRTGTWQEGC
jgi:prepilin-type N-terminal cleavage/methylation domain-containing protein